MRTLKIDITCNDGKFYASMPKLTKDTQIRLPDDQEQWYEASAGHLPFNELGRLGKRLYDAIIPDQRQFGEMRGAAREQSEPLRLIFAADYDALNNVPLEILSTQESPFQDFLGLDDSISLVRSLRLNKPPKLRQLTFPFRLLMVISGPTLSAINPQSLKASFNGLLDVLEASGRLEIDYLGVEGYPESDAENLHRALEQGAAAGHPFDIVWFIGHGEGPLPVATQSEAALEFVDQNTQRERWCNASRLAPMFATYGVQIVLLQACDSAVAAKDDAFQGVAQRLVGEGVPYVVAMQWPIEVDVANCFFNRLLRCWLHKGDGLEAAVVEARNTLYATTSAPTSAWATPVLYMHPEAKAHMVMPESSMLRKMVSGDRGLDKKDWENLVETISDGQCAFVLGPDTGAMGADERREFADQLAREYGYPFALDNENASAIAQATAAFDSRGERYLSKVAQYVAVNRGVLVPKREIGKWWQKNQGAFQHLSRGDKSPLNVAAGLPVKVYATTNHDDLLEQALQFQGREPKPLLCRWNKYMEEDECGPYIVTGDGFEPSEHEPIVFHFFGQADMRFASSIVIAEDDYLDYLVNVSQGDKTVHLSNALAPIPWAVRNALANSALVFVGFDIRDPSFRFLLKSMVPLLQNNSSGMVVSIQLAEVPSKQRASVRTYLKQWLEAPLKFTPIHVECYWGTCQEFIHDLKEVYPSVAHA